MILLRISGNGLRPGPIRDSIHRSLRCDNDGTWPLAMLIAAVERRSGMKVIISKAQRIVDDGENGGRNDDKDDGRHHRGGGGQAHR